MTVSVSQAEAQLRAALASEAKQKRENAKAEIQRLSAEGAVLKARLFKMKEQINTAQADRLRIHGALVHARQQIDKYSASLDPLLFPTIEDERKRKRQLTNWQQEQRRLLAARADAVEREAIRREAILQARQLQSLEYSIENYRAVAEGRQPGQITGGVFTVGEDFIGNMQTAHV